MKAWDGLKMSVLSQSEQITSDCSCNVLCNKRLHSAGIYRIRLFIYWLQFMLKGQMLQIFSLPESLATLFTHTQGRWESEGKSWAHWVLNCSHYKCLMLELLCVVHLIILTQQSQEPHTQTHWWPSLKGGAAEAVTEVLIDAQPQERRWRGFVDETGHTASGSFCCWDAAQRHV